MQAVSSLQNGCTTPPLNWQGFYICCLNLHVYSLNHLFFGMKVNLLDSKLQHSHFFAVHLHHLPFCHLPVKSLWPFFFPPGPMTCAPSRRTNRWTSWTQWPRRLAPASTWQLGSLRRPSSWGWLVDSVTGGWWITSIKMLRTLGLELKKNGFNLEKWWFHGISWRFSTG